MQRRVADLPESKTLADAQKVPSSMRRGRGSGQGSGRSRSYSRSAESKKPLGRCAEGPRRRAKDVTQAFPPVGHATGRPTDPKSSGRRPLKPRPMPKPWRSLSKHIGDVKAGLLLRRGPLIEWRGWHGGSLLLAASCRPLRKLLRKYRKRYVWRKKERFYHSSAPRSFPLFKRPHRVSFRKDLIQQAFAAAKHRHPRGPHPRTSTQD